MSKDTSKDKGDPQDPTDKTQKGAGDPIKGDPNPENKSDKSSKKPPASKELSQVLEENKRLRGTVSVLQGKVNDGEAFQKAIVNAVSPKGADGDEPTLESVQDQITDLKSELLKKDQELSKNNYIDSLEGVGEARKRELKRRVSADSEDLEKAVESEQKALDALIEEETDQKVNPDSRPTSDGAGSLPDTQDARIILKNRDKFKKKWGI